MMKNRALHLREISISLTDSSYYKPGTCQAIKHEAWGFITYQYFPTTNILIFLLSTWLPRKQHKQQKLTSSQLFFQKATPNQSWVWSMLESESQDCRLNWDVENHILEAWNDKPLLTVAKKLHRYLDEVTSSWADSRETLFLALTASLSVNTWWEEFHTREPSHVDKHTVCSQILSFLGKIHLGHS